MDLATLGKLALDLGVIPALALFLVVAMHLQNKRLTKMLERQEENNMELLTLLATQLAALKTPRATERHK